MSNDVFESKLDFIERNTCFLQEHASVSPEEFLSSFKDVQAIKHPLIKVIAACIDISAHIISKEGLVLGQSYAEIASSGRPGSLFAPSFR